MAALPLQLDPAGTSDEQFITTTSAPEATGRCRRCERPVLIGELVVYREADQTMRHTPVCPGGRP